MRQAERAVFDLHRGIPVVLRDSEGDCLIQPVEGLTETALASVLRLAGGSPSLALTRHRLASMTHIIADEAASLPLGSAPELADILMLALARNARVPQGAPVTTAKSSERAAVEMMRRAQVIPAALVVRVIPAHAGLIEASVARGQFLRVNTEEAIRLCTAGPGTLTRVSDARVPIEGAGHCCFVLFRESGGLHEHVAVLIGERGNWPDAVPVRLHSACLTGDVFGSQRCDCGEQLRRGIAAISAEGGGVLLYLSQEGRGIGLGNKFRAYRLQDAGLDTIDADQVIGYSKDERDFRLAHEILDALDVQRIKLLTNNPAKLASLQEAGIDVAHRQAIFGDLNDHNQRYLNTKANRHGHWLNELLNELEPAQSGAKLQSEAGTSDQE